MKKLLITLLILACSSVSVFAAEEPLPAEENTDAVEQQEVPEEEPTAQNESEKESETVEQVEDEQVETVENESVETKSETIEPLNLTASIISSTSVKLTWQGQEDTRYIVKKGSEEIETTNNEYTYTGLGIGETYTFEVSSGEIAEQVTITMPSLQAPVLSVYTGYKGVILEWNRVPDAVAYEIYRDNVYLTKTTALSYYDKHNIETASHSYYIIAVPQTGKKSNMSNTVTKSPVRPMFIKITFKKAVTLKSHDGKRVRRRFKKGQTVQAHSFAAGQYRFYHKGNLFYVNRIRVKKARALYTRSFNYTAKEAESFVNSSGKGSSTAWLIWVSEYTQHCYVFRGAKGRWKLYDNWEIASGKASTPSPKGFSKRIHKKLKSHHGLGPWSCYSSMNAFHGKKKSWNVGKPASNGCIRCPNNKSRWIYKNIPKNTAVIIY